MYDTNENDDLNDESGDKFDGNDQMSSENEEDTVEQDCEDNVDSIYDIDDITELDKRDTDNSQPKKAQTQVVMKLKTSDGAKYYLE